MSNYIENYNEPPKPNTKRAKAMDKLYNLFCPDTGEPDWSQIDKIIKLYPIGYGKKAPIFKWKLYFKKKILYEN